MKHDFHYRSGDVELRPMTYEDSQAYRLLRNQEQNRRRFFYQGLLSEQQQKSWYDRYLQDDTDIMFAFYYQGRFAGGNAVYHIDRDNGRAEYGRLLIDKRNFPQRGLGRSITYGAAHIARNVLSLSTLYSEIYESNLPSMKACLNAGFHEVETRALENGDTVFYIEYALEQLGEKPCEA